MIDAFRRLFSLLRHAAAADYDATLLSCHIFFAIFACRFFFISPP